MAPTATPVVSETTSAASADSGLRGLAAKQLWRDAAPRELRDAWKRGDLNDAWRLLSESLSRCERVEAGRLSWGLSEAAAGDLVSRLNKEWRSEAVEAWVASAAERDADAWFAIEAVSLARQSPRLVEVLGADLWWSLIETLAALPVEVVDGAAPDPAEPEAVVVEQLLAGELPLTLSAALQLIKPLYDLAGGARKVLSAGLERLTDGEGLLAAPLWTATEVPAASLLLACWTRCRLLVGTNRPWNADAQTQYEWLVRQVLRLSDRQGRVHFAPCDAVGSDELLREALRLGGDESDHAAAAKRLKRFSGDDSFEEPAASNHSEWAEVGVLAAGWHDKAPRIVVAHPADTMYVEVHVGKRTLLEGEWPVQASIDGVAVSPTDDWECQCWYSDDECDYLELALPLAGDARLERQFFLAREDGVGFLAETLFSGSNDPKQLAVTTRLPLGDELSLRPEKETREALLTAGGEPVAGLIPLALAEWRDDPRGGELTAEQRRLVLTRDREGRNAVSPLWIDFSPKRFGKQRTWRALTVAETLKTVTPDVAVGYRIQAAKEQWLVYRSLDKPGNRTVLGQNYSSEQVVGRYKAPDATVDEYFEIE